MSILKSHWATAARILLGSVFLIFGLNGFLHFLPMPPLPAEAGSFMGALAATGYFFPLLKGTEVVAGLLLLSGRLVPVALIALAPILVNIFAFHLFLAPGLGLPIVIVALELALAWHHREAFRPLFRPAPAVETPDARPTLGRPAHAN